MVSRAVSLKALGRRVANCLKSHGIGVEGLYLFGSQARGEATEDSDIDVLLVSPGYPVKGFWQRCSLVGRALAGLSDPVRCTR
jgi:predicted nucleotidyltransferase